MSGVFPTEIKVDYDEMEAIPSFSAGFFGRTLNFILTEESKRFFLEGKARQGYPFLYWLEGAKGVNGAWEPIKNAEGQYNVYVALVPGSHETVSVNKKGQGQKYIDGSVDRTFPCIVSDGFIGTVHPILDEYLEKTGQKPLGVPMRYMGAGGLVKNAPNEAKSQAGNKFFDIRNKSFFINHKSVIWWNPEMVCIFNFSYDHDSGDVDTYKPNPNDFTSGRTQSGDISNQIANFLARTLPADDEYSLTLNGADCINRARNENKEVIDFNQPAESWWKKYHNNNQEKNIRHMRTIYMAIGTNYDFLKKALLYIDRNIKRMRLSPERELLEKNTLLNMRFSKLGDTALIKAVREDDGCAVRALLDHGAAWDVQNDEGDSALSVAVRTGNQKLAVVFLQFFKKDAKDSELELVKLLDTAIRFNKVSVIPLLIGKLFFYFPQKYNFTNVSMVNQLFGCFPDVNFDFNLDVKNRLVLTLAISGHFNILELLICSCEDKFQNAKYIAFEFIAIIKSQKECWDLFRQGLEIAANLGDIFMVLALVNVAEEQKIYNKEDAETNDYILSKMLRSFEECPGEILEKDFFGVLKEFLEKLILLVHGNLSDSSRTEAERFFKKVFWRIIDRCDSDSVEVMGVIEFFVDDKNKLFMSSILDISNSRALSITAAKGRKLTVEKLLRCRDEKDCNDDELLESLYQAIKNNHEETVKILKEPLLRNIPISQEYQDEFFDYLKKALFDDHGGFCQLNLNEIVVNFLLSKIGSSEKHVSKMAEKLFFLILSQEERWGVLKQVTKIIAQKDNLIENFSGITIAQAKNICQKMMEFRHGKITPENRQKVDLFFKNVIDVMIEWVGDADIDELWIFFLADDHKDIIKPLVARPKNKTWFSPLTDAARYGNKVAVERLLAYRDDKDEDEEELLSALHYAVHKEDKNDAIIQLLKDRLFKCFPVAEEYQREVADNLTDILDKDDGSRYFSLDCVVIKLLLAKANDTHHAANVVAQKIIALILNAPEEKRLDLICFAELKISDGGRLAVLLAMIDFSEQHTDNSFLEIIYRSVNNFLFVQFDHAVAKDDIGFIKNILSCRNLALEFLGSSIVGASRDGKTEALRMLLGYAQDRAKDNQLEKVLMQALNIVIHKLKVFYNDYKEIFKLLAGSLLSWFPEKYACGKEHRGGLIAQWSNDGCWDAIRLLQETGQTQQSECQDQAVSISAAQNMRMGAR